MISAWKAGRKAGRKNQPGEKHPGKIEVIVPNHFRCPISLDLMKDPVTLSTGITYDRQSIETWLDAGNRTCPVTNQILHTLEQIPNHALRKMIQDWCVANSSSGFVRNPTPRVPATQPEVVRILSEISSSSSAADLARCGAAVAKLRSLGKDSERNQRCIAGGVVASGAKAVSILSAAFESFAGKLPESAVICEEILAVLTWLYPLDSSALSSLGSARSVRCMAWFLRFGNLAGRKNAALAVKEVASSLDARHVEVLGETDGLSEALIDLIKSPICPAATKASLVAIYCLASCTEKTRLKIATAGSVPALLEILSGSERGICERVLAALDVVCDSREGREMALGHALTVPVLVKKICKVSDLSTEFAVSILCKLWKNSEEERFLFEGLQVGAFQKLLLLLQVGCSKETKEKATNLLKILNAYRNRLECVDPLDFKELKRPF